MLVDVAVESSFAKLLFELGEQERFFAVMMMMNQSHESDAKHHEILNLIFLYSMSMVDHCVDPLEECVMGTSHVDGLTVKYIFDITRWDFEERVWRRHIE